MEDLKVKISINGRETEKYKLQTLVTDIENQELWIVLKTKDNNTETKSEITSPQEILKETLKEAIKEVGPIPVIETRPTSTILFNNKKFNQEKVNGG